MSNRLRAPTWEFEFGLRDDFVGGKAPYQWLPTLRVTPPERYVSIPLWMLALPTAAGSFFLWRSLRRERMRAADKPCPKCGYSLVGLADGVACPECGKGGRGGGGETS